MNESDEQKQVDSLLGLKGEGLWDYFSNSPHYHDLEPSLREVLQIMGYDRLITIAELCVKDVDRIIEFMRKTLHRILAKKSNNKDNYEASLKKYYGEFYMHIPEEYEILSGHLHQIFAIVESAKKIVLQIEQDTSNKFRFENSVKNCQESSESTTTNNITHNPPPPSPSDILTEKESLDRNIKRWLSLNASSIALTDNFEESLQTMLTFKSGALIAMVTCPFKQCNSTYRVNKINGRWAPSNYYKHCRRHAPKNSPITGGTEQAVFNNLFTTKNNNRIIDNSTAPTSKIDHLLIPKRNNSDDDDDDNDDDDDDDDDDDNDVSNDSQILVKKRLRIQFPSLNSRDSAENSEQSGTL